MIPLSEVVLRPYLGQFHGHGVDLLVLHKDAGGLNVVLKESVGVCDRFQILRGGLVDLLDRRQRYV